MNKNFVYIAAAATAIFLILRRTSFAKNLIFSLNNIEPKGQIYKPELLISLQVQNPTNQQANINSISGTLFLQDKAISNVSNFVRQTILPRQDSVISFLMKPGVIGIFNVVREIYTGTKSQQYKFKFVGSVNVDGVLMPINQDFIL